jgi:hypothetical protein
MGAFRKKALKTSYTQRRLPQVKEGQADRGHSGNNRPISFGFNCHGRGHSAMPLNKCGWMKCGTSNPVTR